MDFNFVKEVRQKCQSNPKTIVLPELDDPRVLEAAYELIIEKAVSRVVSPFDQSQVLELAKQVGGVEVSPLIKFFSSYEQVFPGIVDATYKQYKVNLVRRGKSVSEDVLEVICQNPLYQASFLVAEGMADFGVAGAVNTTSDVIRSAISMIGLSEGIKKISSSFIMDRGKGKIEDLLLYADCGVIIDPSQEDLVDIAEGSLDLWQSLLGKQLDPVVAFLSFSTKGSAKHPHSEKIRAAAESFAAKHPEILSDGELQFDAAYIESVGKRKASTSRVPGKANLFVFPDLNSGNIAYKITQRLAGYHAYGPILQGVAKPFSDLSRGSSVHDIKVSAYINSLRCN